MILRKPRSGLENFSDTGMAQTKVASPLSPIEANPILFCVERLRYC